MGDQWEVDVHVLLPVRAQKNADNHHAHTSIIGARAGPRRRSAPRTPLSRCWPSSRALLSLAPLQPPPCRRAARPTRASPSRHEPDNCVQRLAKGLIILEGLAIELAQCAAAMPPPPQRKTKTGMAGGRPRGRECVAAPELSVPAVRPSCTPAG